TTFFAAILMVLPVCGFLPSLAARCATDQEPNPTKDTRSPFLRVFSTLPKKDSKLFLAAAFVIPASSAIALIKSDLFIIQFLLFKRYKIAYTNIDLLFNHASKKRTKPLIMV